MDKKQDFKYKLLSFLVILNTLLFTFWILGLKNITTTSSYPEFSEIKNISNFPELSKFFTQVAEKKGAKYAYDLLRVAPLPPNTDLHLLGHFVGDVLYKQQGAKGIKICTQEFRNACSHSIVVGLLLDKGEGALLEISKACYEAPGGKGAYTMCFHGLGHGILAYTNYDLSKAVEICKRTGTPTHNNREYIECVGGAIMEIISGGAHDPAQWEKQSKKYLSNTDPLSPCDQDIIPNEAKAQCYVYLTPHLFQVAGADLGRPTEKDFEKAFTYCKDIPLTQKENQDACFGGFGKEFVVVAKERDIRNIEQMTDQELNKVYNWCNLANDNNGIKQCIISSVSSLYWGGENDPRTAVNFCKITEGLASFCFSNLQDDIAFYGPNDNYKREFCATLPEGYKNDCTKRFY